MSFELPNHYLKLTGLENLAYFRALYSDETQAPEALLDLVGLQDDGKMLVSQYSKGMKTRLGVARALLNNPGLIFMDEPTAGLDPVSARRIKDLIRAQQRNGRTVFLTTHDMTVADELCDRVAFIVDGEIRLIESPRELKLAHGERTIQLVLVDAARRTMSVQRRGRETTSERAARAVPDLCSEHASPAARPREDGRPAGHAAWR